jgi:ribosomal protein S19E (S16A)
MCSIQIKLTEQHKAAELAYRSGVARMKEMRGQEFERASRLVEHRRASLECARQVLREHEQEHLCGIQKSSAVIAR